MSHICCSHIHTYHILLYTSLAVVVANYKLKESLVVNELCKNGFVEYKIIMSTVLYYKLAMYVAI